MSELIESTEQELADPSPFDLPLHLKDVEQQNAMNVARLRELFMFHHALAPSTSSMVEWIARIDAHIEARSAAQANEVKA